LIFNRCFDSSRIDYSGGYDNALQFSEVFCRYADEIAGALVRDLGLRGRDVVDIGCGDGDFLGRLCRLGARSGIGFDPAAEASPSLEAVGVTVRSDDFSPNEIDTLDVGLIACRHVLEHLVDPISLLTTIRMALENHEGACAYLEVPSGDFMLRHDGFWDVIYEHHTAFTRSALLRALELAGLCAIDVRETYGGQYVVGVVKPGSGTPPSKAGIAEVVENAKSFAVRFELHVASWRTMLTELHERGARTALWGAGSKGVSFVNVLDGNGVTIRAVVDRNTRKQGCRIVGTGHRIIAPAQLVEEDVDHVILLNRAYEGEVLHEINDLGVTCTCIGPDLEPVRPAVEHPVLVAVRQLDGSSQPGAADRSR
jgi:SAM-dependent methyltransferase